MTEPSSAPPAFQHHLRVYWEDTDAGGVVFYANYLKFFERARTEWLRALGFSQQRMREDSGAIFVVTDTRVSYRQPARLDDLIGVTVQVLELRPASMRFQQQAWRTHAQGADLLAEGEIRIGCVDLQSFKPRRMPADVLNAARAAQG